MKAALFALALLVLAARDGGPAHAMQQQADSSPGREAVENCLASPNRNCALAAALMVTSEEELAISRVDTLLAVADTFQRVGEHDRALATARLARETAQEIGLTVALEQKLRELVGTLAALGEVEEATAIAEGLSDRFDRADALGAIALALGREGDIAGAQAMLDRIEVPLIALRHAVDLTEEIAERGTIEATATSALEARIAAADHRLLQALGYARLAVVEARAGRVEEARRLRGLAGDATDRMQKSSDLARLLAALARADLALGDSESHDLNVTRARTMALRVRDELERTLAIGDVVAALGTGGRVDEAVELAREVSDIRSQSALIRRLAGRESGAAAVEPLAPHLLETAASHDSRFERDRARLAVAEALSAVDRVGRAAEVIGTIENDDTQAQALAVLARALD